VNTERREEWNNNRVRGVLPYILDLIPLWHLVSRGWGCTTYSMGTGVTMYTTASIL
jgi:hypothetical protein